MLYIFIAVNECIDIEYDNKINFVFNVYTHYFKTIYYNFVYAFLDPHCGSKVNNKTIKGKRGMADYNLQYILYYYLC